MITLQSLIDAKDKIKKSINDNLNNPWIKYTFYISALLLALLTAAACVAGAIALIFSFGLTWPIILAMAPLGAIFFGSITAAFSCANEFSILRVGLHYVMSGLNAAINAAYVTSSVLKVGLGLGIGLAGGPVGWVIGGGMLITATLGFALGIMERKQKYDENKTLKGVLDTKRQQLASLNERLKAKEEQLQSLQKPLAKKLAMRYLAQWQEREQEIRNEQVKRPAQATQISQGVFSRAIAKFTLGAGNKVISLIQYTVLLPFADKKEQADKLKQAWREKVSEFSFTAAAKSTLDSAIDNFNTIKNYARNLKLISSLLPGVILIVLGIHTLNPLLVVGGIAAGIAFASMNYYRDKWEDKVFSKNTEYQKQIATMDMEIALTHEKDKLLEQLTQIEKGIAIETTRTEAEQTKFCKKFYNPLKKANHKTSTMFGLATYTAFETFAYSGLALAAAIIGLKLAPVTGGVSILIGAGVATVFGVMAVGNLVRRGVKETKQASKKTELEAEYKYLKNELKKYKHIKSAAELDRIKIHNYRSSLGGVNYSTYKAASGLKKAEKSYGLITDILSHGHPLIVGIGIGVVTLNPVFLCIGLIVGGILAYTSYKAEQLRIHRDKVLDDLKLMNESMRVELKRLKAAKQRISLVEQAQMEYAKQSSEQSCNTHGPERDRGPESKQVVNETPPKSNEEPLEINISRPVKGIKISSDGMFEPKMDKVDLNKQAEDDTSNTTHEKLIPNGMEKKAPDFTMLTGSNTAVSKNSHSFWQQDLAKKQSSIGKLVEKRSMSPQFFALNIQPCYIQVQNEADNKMHSILPTAPAA